MIQTTSGIVELLKAAEKSAAFKGQLCPQVFDPSCKSFVLSLESPSSRVSLPAMDKPLSLISPFLNFQLFLLPGKPFALELGVMDSGNTKRRLVFSSAVKKSVAGLMCVRTGNEEIPRSVWVNLCVDVVSFSRLFFPSATFRSVEEITVRSYCRLRRIFGSRQALIPASDKSCSLLPKAFGFHPSVEAQSCFFSPDLPSSMQKPPVASKKPQNLLNPLTSKQRELRTASPQPVPRIVSSSSPAARPQKSAPPHRILPPKRLKPPSKSPLRSDFTSLSPTNNRKPPANKRAKTLGMESMHTTAYSKFDSAATNLTEEAGSVQEEIEEELKSAEKSSTKRSEANLNEKWEIREEICAEVPTQGKFLETKTDFLTDERPYSPPFLGLTERSSAELLPEAKTIQSGEEIELLHDPVLRCFYNPATEEYFELDN